MSSGRSIVFFGLSLLTIIPNAPAQSTPVPTSISSAEVVAALQEQPPDDVCSSKVRTCYKVNEKSCDRLATRLFKNGLRRSDPPKRRQMTPADQTPIPFDSPSELKKIMPETLTKSEVTLWENAISAFWRRSMVRMLDKANLRRRVRLAGACQRLRGQWLQDPSPVLQQFRPVTKRDLKKTCDVAKALDRRKRFHTMPFDWRAERYFNVVIQHLRSPETVMAFARIRENAGFSAAEEIRAFAADWTGQIWSCASLDRVLQGPEFSADDDYSQPSARTKMPDPGLSAATFKAVMDAAMTDFTNCYAQRLKKKPDLQGRIFSKVTLDSSGVVRRVAMRKDGTTLIDTPLFQCLRARITKLKFPPTGIKRPQTLVYPFEFKVR